jgi:glutamine---fructose-6-phosphate transaminase (isomerizing)
LGRARGTIDQATEARLSKALTEVPSRVTEMLRQAPYIAQLATVIAEARDVLYLGRGLAYPLALEGALKLKEISYIHAEGYAAGEMKHGPIALIDEHVPVIMRAPRDELFEKTASNVQEAAARGGKVVMISDRDGLKRLDGGAEHIDGFGFQPWAGNKSRSVSRSSSVFSSRERYLQIGSGSLCRPRRTRKE